MNASTLRAIYNYGAVLSVIATAVAAVAFVVNGQNSFLGLLFGFFGPFCGFFFIGAVLSHTARYHDLGEECLRGIVWHFGSLVGWGVIATASNALSITPFTVFGLPVLTALGIVLLFVGIRRETGLDLKAKTESGQLLLSILGTIVGGFLVLSFVLVEGRSPLLVPVYLLATVVGFGLWQRHLRPQRVA
ncbi:hypothetical protein [Natrinema salaciae]|uniref:Uncharacterized protein n=1 Tax=Natrinema salaciae TaxID=1186196 RepID=A0A1H9NHC1_9EURY|nr:hypothetical protein [Natrinema salaciae]SER35322.1 hypothetical protein SAMN04489841_3601 [Natrinema salaciae]